MQTTIRYERERRGWSRAELGNRVGVTAHMIGMLERGKTPGSLILVWRIARVLGTSIDALMRGTETPEETTPWALM